MDYFHRRFLKVRFYISHKGIYILVTQSCINTCHYDLLNGVYFQLTYLRGFEANLLLDGFFSKFKRVVSMHVSVHIEVSYGITRWVPTVGADDRGGGGSLWVYPFTFPYFMFTPTPVSHLQSMVELDEILLMQGRF